MFKIYNNIAQPIFTEIFIKRNPKYQLRHTSHFSVPPVRSVYNRTEILPFLGPKIWDIVSIELNEAKTLTAFKSGDHKTVYAGYVSDICQVLVLNNLDHFHASL